MSKIFNWVRKNRWSLVSALLVGVLLSQIGIQIAHPGLTDKDIGSWIGEERVITIGSVADAAGDLDYTLDGTDDNVQLLAALNALPATGGRLVIVSAVQINFSAGVTRAIPNVTIEGSGTGTYFVRDGVNPLFTAGGNNWHFANLRTDAGGLAMGATTGGLWTNVTVDTQLYSYYAPTTGIGAVFDLTVEDDLVVDDDATVTGDLDAATGRTATYIVAASDAPAHVKAQADYVCDGTADNVEIQAAITTLPTEGGHVVLTSGLFTITDTINILDKPVWLQGDGIGWTHADGDETFLYGGTVITAADGFAKKMIRVYNSAAATQKAAGTLISDLKLYQGFPAENLATYGIYVDGGGSACHQVKVQNVSISGLEGYGLEAGGGEFIGNNLYIRGCRGSGARITGSDNILSNSILGGNGGTTYDGVLTTGSVILSTIYSYGNGRCGFFMSNGSQITATNLWADNNREAGIGIGYPGNTGVHHVTLTNCTAVNNGQDNTKTGSRRAGICVIDSYDVTISGCSMYGNGTDQLYGLFINDFTNDTRVTVSGCVIAGNYNSGIISGLGGIATGADYVTVTGCVFDSNGQQTNNTYYDIQLDEHSGDGSTYWIISDNIFKAVAANKVKYNITESTNSNYNLITGNIFSGAVTSAINKVGVNTVASNNQGYIAPGEVRTVSGSLTGGAENTIVFAWHNPEAQDILIKKVVVNVTTADASAANIDVGIADDATYTNGGTEFFNDLAGETAQLNDSWVAGDGGAQTKWVLCQDSASATDGWVVGKALGADATDLVGSYYIEYTGK